DVEMQCLGMSRFGALLRGGRRVRMALGRPDDVIVHTQDYRGDRLSAAYLAPFTRIATCRNYPRHDYPMKYGRLRGTLLAGSHFKVFRRLPTVVACSATMAGMLTPHGVNALTILNGVDGEAFTV